jgi:hypothetical protein
VSTNPLPSSACSCRQDREESCYKAHIAHFVAGLSVASALLARLGAVVILYAECRGQERHKLRGDNTMVVVVAVTYPVPGGTSQSSSLTMIMAIYSAIVCVAHRAPAGCVRPLLLYDCV